MVTIIQEDNINNSPNLVSVSLANDPILEQIIVQPGTVTQTQLRLSHKA